MCGCGRIQHVSQVDLQDSEVQACDAMYSGQACSQCHSHGAQRLVASLSPGAGAGAAEGVPRCGPRCDALTACNATRVAVLPCAGGCSCVRARVRAAFTHIRHSRFDKRPAVRCV